MATMTREEFRALSGKRQSKATPAKPQKKDALATAAKVADTVFGAGKIGDYIGTKVGYALATPEQRKYYDTSTPTGKELLGSAARSALLFAPVGKGAALAASGLKAAAPKLGMGAAKTLGAMGAGASIGYAGDVAYNASEGKEDISKAGLGTILGGGLPLLGPIGRGITRTMQESSGAATGAGYGSIKVGADAALKGGKAESAFRSALRGNVDGETIRKEAVDALTQIKQRRSQAYQNQVAKLKTSDTALDTGPVVKKLYDDLESFGVGISNDKKTGERVLDFSRSPGLGRYEKEVRQLADTVENWGSKEGDNTIIGIDKLKQTIRDFRRGGMESKSLDNFVTGLSNEAKNLGKNEPGYSKLLSDYEEATDIIDDITQNLSLGERANVDTGIRKLTSVLRTNNEFRRQLVDELNQETGGTLVPKIAGQQLSELAPRGLARSIGGLGAVGGLVSGVGIVPILQAAIFTSPRVVGEVLLGLGITGRAAAPVLNAIQTQKSKVPWEAIFPGESAPKEYQSDSLDLDRPENIPTSASATYTKNAAPNANASSSMPNSLNSGSRKMTREEFRALSR